MASVSVRRAEKPDSSSKGRESGRGPSLSSGGQREDASAAGAPWERWMRVVLPCAVFVIVFIAFIPALSGEFLNWDDDKNFTQNEFWRGLGPSQIAWMFTAFHLGHYQPITWLTLGLNFEIAGMNPWVYHLTNNLLHAVNAVLVYCLAMRLIGCARREAAGGTAWRVRVGALVAALLWGVHPLRVESVAWITERRDLVSGVFILLALLAYLRYVAAAPGRRALWYAIVIAMFVLSLLGKVIGVTLPLVMLLLDWYPLRRFDAAAVESDETSVRTARRRIVAVILEKLPLLFIALIFGSIVAYFDRERGWIMGLADHSVGARVGQVTYGLVFYAWKSVVPMNLFPLREIDRAINPLAGKYLLCMSLVVVTAAVVLVFRRKVPAVAVAAIVYAVALAPTLGIVQTGAQMVADRYSYLSTIGFAIIAGGAITLLRPRTLRVLVIPISAVILTLAIAASRQCRVWHDSFSLWDYSCRVKNNQSTYAWVKFGMLLNDRSRFEEAEHAFRRSVEVDARNAKAWFLLGNALYRGGQADAALEALAESVSRDPRPFEPYYNAAYILMKLGRLDEAAGTFQKALERTPTESKSVNKTLAEAHINLGIVLLRLGRRDEAEPHLRESVRLDPALRSMVDQLTSPAPAATQAN